VGSGEAVQPLFSEPVPVEEVGETCVWLMRDAGGNVRASLASASVMVDGPTIFVAIRDVSSTPPYRIENRWVQSGLFALSSHDPVH
jgi:hypothetical protein